MKGWKCCKQWALVRKKVRGNEGDEDGKEKRKAICTKEVVMGEGENERRMK